MSQFQCFELFSVLYLYVKPHFFTLSYAFSRQAALFHVKLRFFTSSRTSREHKIEPEKAHNDTIIRSHSIALALALALWLKFAWRLTRRFAYASFAWTSTRRLGASALSAWTSTRSWRCRGSYAAPLKSHSWRCRGSYAPLKSHSWRYRGSYAAPLKSHTL